MDRNSIENEAQYWQIRWQRETQSLLQLIGFLVHSDIQWLKIKYISHVCIFRTNPFSYHRTKIEYYVSISNFVLRVYMKFSLEWFEILLSLYRFENACNLFFLVFSNDILLFYFLLSSKKVDPNQTRINTV